MREALSSGGHLLRTTWRAEFGPDDVPLMLHACRILAV
jgi:hypothetical protein